MNKFLIFFIVMTASIASSAGEYYKCTTETGDVGKFTFRGDTREEAFMRSVKMCLSMRVQKYVAARFHPPDQDRTILFMEDCVNHTYCLENTIKDSNE